MNDHDLESNQEDLSEFEDYLSGFDLLIKYDSEACSCCCVENSDSFPIQNSPFVLYKSITDDLELSLLTHKLKLRFVNREIFLMTAIRNIEYNNIEISQYSQRRIIKL
jgi:hypothetical protein